MNKLIATLILGLSLSGAALADNGYFADYQGDFSNAPVSAGQPYEGVALDWTHREVPAPTSNTEGFTAVENQNEWMKSAG